MGQATGVIPLAGDRGVPRTVLWATLVVVGVAATLYLLYRLRQPLAWLVIATFIAVVLAGPANLLSRRLPRGLAIAITYLVVLLVPIGLAPIVLPPFVRQATNLVGVDLVNSAFARSRSSSSASS